MIVIYKAPWFRSRYAAELLKAVDSGLWCESSVSVKTLGYRQHGREFFIYGLSAAKAADVLQKFAGGKVQMVEGLAA